jgi:hypothetical protein
MLVVRDIERVAMNVAAYIADKDRPIDEPNPGPSAVEPPAGKRPAKKDPNDSTKVPIRNPNTGEPLQSN